MDKTQYFSLPHATHINVEPVTDGSVLDMQQLQREIPPLFQLASEITPLDSSVLRGINHLGEKAEGLVNYLQYQSRKIDAILGFILNQQDLPELRYHTSSLGASGLTFHADSPFQPDTAVRLKIFIPEESLAIYCFAKVTDCEPQAQGYQIALAYQTIREEDEEILIKATLHLQTRMLKQRADSRKQE